jgi:hypothetical protein
MHILFGVLYCLDLQLLKQYFPCVQASVHEKVRSCESKASRVQDLDNR